MIQTNVKGLTLIQRKLINFMLFTIQREGDKKRYTTNIRTIKELCKIKSTENVDFKEQFEKLREISIEFNYLNKDKNMVWESMCLVSAVRFIVNTGKAVFEVPYMLREKILIPNIYAPLDVLLIAGLKSKYSIILYELLRDYIDAQVFPKLSIEQLRSLLGLERHQYKDFQNFKKWVLDRAVNEVNEKTDIQCSYTLVKEHGNKYAYIEFEVQKNERFEMQIPKRAIIDNHNRNSTLERSTKPRNAHSVVAKEHTEVKENTTDKLDDEIIKALTNRGITGKVAEVLVREYPDRISEKIKVFDWLKKAEDNRISKNPAGYLRKSIEENYPPPDDYVASIKEEKSRKLREEREKREAQKLMEESRHHQKILGILKEMKENEPEKYKAMELEARKEAEAQLNYPKLDPSLRRSLLNVGIGTYMRKYVEEGLEKGGEELEREKEG